MWKDLEVILNLLTQAQIPLTILMVLVTIVSLGSACLGFASYWTIRPDYFASGEDLLLRRQELRSVGIPAFFALISGFLISVSASLAVLAFQSGAQSWALLGLAFFCFVLSACTVIPALSLAARVRMRIDPEDRYSSPARIRAFAGGMSGNENDCSDFMTSAYYRLQDSDLTIAKEILPRAGERSLTRVGWLIGAAPVDPSLPLRETLGRSNRRPLLVLQSALVIDAARRMGWPVIVPLCYVLWGLATGVVATQASDLGPALLLAGFGFTIGAFLVVAHYWVAGICAFRRIAARTYEVEAAAAELERLQLRIDAHRRRGMRGVWLRLTGRS